MVTVSGKRFRMFIRSKRARVAPRPRSEPDGRAWPKTLADGETTRAKILGAYEKAELTEDPAERARLLTFVLVGAGPTGVELAASIAQMATITFHSNFRNIDPSKTSITLLDGAKRILPSFAESLSRKAAKRLDRLGVKILTDAKVDKVDDQGVIVAGKRLESATVLWTAGVAPSPILKGLNAKTDRVGLLVRFRRWQGGGDWR
jgi:NADH dehydrogenase